MIKNIWIGVLITAVAALAIAVGLQSHEIEMLRAEKQMIATSLAEKVKATPVPAPVEETQAPSPEAKPVEPVAVAAAVPSAAPAEGSTNNPFAGMAQMMKSPQMKEMMRAQQKVSIDGMYGSLSKYLNLSTNDMDALKELLLQRQMALMDAGMSAMSGSGTDPKQAAANTQAVKADYDKQIQDLLGPQEYPFFKITRKPPRTGCRCRCLKAHYPQTLH